MKKLIHKLFSHMLRPKNKEPLAQNGTRLPPYCNVKIPSTSILLYLKVINKELSPIIITGRFRSGSTLLWNIFRDLPECTAYYEPFNERRWFDKTLKQ